MAQIDKNDITIVTMDYMLMSMAFVPVMYVNTKKTMNRKRNIT